jgi:hypothetical protein
MDVVFDEVKGNVIDPAAGGVAEREAPAPPRAATDERNVRDDLARMAARRRRLEAH